MRVLLWLVLAWASSAAAQSLRITGTVTSGGAPVPNAKVQIGQTTLTADAAGRFSTEHASGNIELTVDGPPGSGFLQKRLQNVPIDRDTEIRIALQRPVRVSGRVQPVGGPPFPLLRLYSLTHETAYRFGVPDDGRFILELPPDAYAIEAVPDVPRHRAGRTNVDARAGNVDGVEITMSAVDDQPMQIAAPIASRITVSAPDAEGVATVTGAAGAVEPVSAVAVANLFTDEFVTTVSNGDGGFSLSLFAPPGSVLQIKQDPTGHFIPQTSGNNNVLDGAAGTLIYVPAPAGTFSIMAVVGAGLEELLPAVSAAIGNAGPFWWQAKGTWTTRTLSPGDSVTLTGTLALFGKTPIPDPASIQIRGGMQALRYFDAQGRERRIDNDFVSGIMTPTGLPIGHVVQTPSFGAMTVGPLVRTGSHYETPIQFTGKLPADLPPGHYRFVPSFFIDGLPKPVRSFDASRVVFSINERRPAALPVVRVGQPLPPKLAWVLGLDDSSNGTRGTIALEDRGVFGIASHIVTNSDTFILPMKDDRTGRPLRYRLEPFTPMLSRGAGNGSLTEVPHVPLKLPSGSLKVTVTRPDGTVQDLGSAVFAQAALKTPITRAGNPANSASFHVSDFLRLTTLDPRFEYEFTQYGRHRISMTGSVEDLDGNVYSGGGTYEVWIAKTLDLETAVLPGAPFHVGDAFSPAVIVQPGLPAYVEVELQLLVDSRSDRAVRRTFSGWANRFGLFSPPESQLMTGAGEYRVDVTASHLDDQGVLWMGASTWGGVVATPASPIVTHGRRGFDLADGPQPQWFRVPEARTGGDHVIFPFHSGDIMWMSKFDPAADIPKITVQDNGGAFAARVRARAATAGPRWEQPFNIEDRITAGEIPLFSSVSPARPPVEPENIDQWGYFYASANRPGVRVRELISGDFSPSGYWRFTGDAYGFQLGTGINGDLPNDFKFQLGGAVFRDESDGFRYYGGYASLFVLLPEDDRTGRVFPPFHEEGGPILKLAGKDVDIFFHPTALRPGSIVVRGQTISFAGYAAPTLRSKVDIRVIAPSGRERIVAGSTNEFGYFHRPDANFTADESGVWRARVSITNEGPTSAGPLQPPFPTGHVLGSREGEVYFYVVDADAPSASIEAPRESYPTLSGPIDLTLGAAEPLTARELTYTITASGFVLDEGRVSIPKYTYDLAALSETFPNLDRFDVDGRFSVETVTLSFLLSGTAANGTRVFRARQLLLQGEQLLAPNQDPPPPSRRRRTVRSP